MSSPPPGLSAWTRAINMFFRYGAPTISPLPGVDLAFQGQMVRVDEPAPTPVSCDCNKAKLLRATVCIAIETLTLLAIHKKGLPSRVTRVLSERHVKCLTGAVALFCLFKVVLKACPHNQPRAPADPQHRLNVGYTFSLRPDKFAQWALGKLGGFIWPGAGGDLPVSPASPVAPATAAEQARVDDDAGEVPAAPGQAPPENGDENSPPPSPSAAQELNDASVSPPPSPVSASSPSEAERQQGEGNLSEQDADAAQEAPVGVEIPGSPCSNSFEQNKQPDSSVSSRSLAPRFPLASSPPLSPIIRPLLSPVSTPNFPQSPVFSSVPPPVLAVAQSDAHVPVLLAQVPEAAAVSAAATNVLNPPASPQPGMLGTLIGYASSAANMVATTAVTLAQHPKAQELAGDAAFAVLKVVITGGSESVINPTGQQPRIAPPPVQSTSQGGGWFPSSSSSAPAPVPSSTPLNNRAPIPATPAPILPPVPAPQPAPAQFRVLHGISYTKGDPQKAGLGTVAIPSSRKDGD